MRSVWISSLISCALLASCAKKTPEAEAPVAAKPAEPAKQEEPKVEQVAATAVLPDGSQLAFSPIYFDFDSADLRADARSTLQAVADKLKQTPAAKLVIEGHCDELGTQEYNLALGDRRARAAQNYLVRLGVEEPRVEVVSYGEEKPADSGKDQAAYAKNRRGEIVKR